MRHAFSLWEWVRGGDQAKLAKFIHWLGPVEEGLRSYPFGLVTYTGLPAGSSLKGFEIASERDSPQQYSYLPEGMKNKLSIFQAAMPRSVKR
jgi:hypothetical protein